MLAKNQEGKISKIVYLALRLSNLPLHIKMGIICLLLFLKRENSLHI